MSRSDVLNGVMNNYKRFYMRKSFLSYPWIRDSFKRRYMLGCLKAFLKSTFERRFYDLGRIGYRGQKEIDFQFDPSKVLDSRQLVQLKRKAPADKPISTSVMACGGSPTAEVHRALAPELAAGGAEGEATIDEFFDPRGFARQQRARRRAAHGSTILDEAIGEEPTLD